MAEQRSKEWFQQRIGRVTGSNVGAALGVNPYKTPDDLIRQMVREYHGAESEFQGNVATFWGQNNEPTALLDFEMETGKTVSDVGFLTYQDWLGASPDGLIDGEPAVTEIKCPFGQRSKNTPQFKSAKDQPHYYGQMQIEMLCADAERCYFYQWAPHGTALETVDRDDEWLAVNVPLLHDFHLRYLSELDNPEHLEPKLKEVNTLRAQQIISEYHELGEALEAAKHRQGELMQELVRLTGERNSMVCGHKLTRVERQGSISYAKVVKKHCPDVDLEQYRGNPSAFWKLTRSV